MSMKTKHKWFREYSTSEVNRTKKTHCADCKYLLGVCSSKIERKGVKHLEDPNAFYDKNGHRYYVGDARCEYMAMTGKMRNCRPEICPYNQNNDSGVYLEKGEEHCNFEVWCKECKYKDLTMQDLPCNKCLSKATNKNTNKPVYFERRTEEDAHKD